MKSDKQITIDNLRELADHGDAWPVDRFDMQTFATTQDEFTVIDHGPNENLNECGTSCCLIGIAAARGMGKPDAHYDFEVYSRSIFPSISLYANSTWDELFGPELPNIMPDRTQALRDYADKLEAES